MEWWQGEMKLLFCRVSIVTIAIRTYLINNDKTARQIKETMNTLRMILFLAANKKKLENKLHVTY